MINIQKVSSKMAELELYYLFQDGDCTYAVGYSAIYVRVPYSLQEYYILLDTVRSCSGSGRNSAAFLASNNNLSARLVGVGRVMNEVRSTNRRSRVQRTVVSILLSPGTCTCATVAQSSALPLQGLAAL